MQSLPAIIKLLFYAALVLIGLYLLFRYRKELLAALRNFIKEVRSFWNWLWGRRQQPDSALAEVSELAAEPVYRSFASYSNPFATSATRDWTPEQMVRYSFDALEAWARESGWARLEHETPNEFTRSLGRHRKQLASALRCIGRLYSRAAYAPGTLPRSCLEDVRGFWQVLPDSAVPGPAQLAAAEDLPAT